MPRPDTRLLEELRDSALLLPGNADDHDRVLEMIGDARVVLIGEASHGTHEFYHERAEITKRLITEKGFAAVACEADWPDAYCVDRYVRGRGPDRSADDALSGFRRFPQWMWRNTVVIDFVDWLRAHNASLADDAAHAGFYGLDLYSLHTSIHSVLRYLQRVDPEAYERARHRYGCFDHFGDDSQAYGYAASFNVSASCEAEVVRQLVDLRARAAEYAGRDGQVAADDFFSAEQNARLVKNAEEYYRSMFRGRVSSWNLRDRHMAETLGNLVRHLESKGREAKVVVWAHNSHLGDARFTDMGRGGELNLGQLARQMFGEERAFLLGFTTYAGTVTAADNWDEPAQRKRVRPGLRGSYEELFHEVGIPRFLLDLRRGDVAGALAEPRLERAIGVIYRPETERMSHYFNCELSHQFDAVIHLDETRALEPLEMTATWEHGEVPETYPSAL